jgi:hypothetical protein
MFRRDHLYATRPCDRPVPASQDLSRLVRIVKRDCEPGFRLVSGLSRSLIGFDVDREAVAFLVEHGR